MTHPYINEVAAYKFACIQHPGECMGARCMAWRWKPLHEEITTNNTRFPPPPSRFKGYSKELGHCGLVKG